MNIETEIDTMELQMKNTEDYLQPLESRRGKEGSSSEFGGTVALLTPISDSKSPELWENKWLFRPSSS